MLINYSSNNSGGSWWLKDEDWLALEKAGWKVEWHKNNPVPIMANPKEPDRWLGALATNASKEFATVREALGEFERITGQDVADEGCNCCGAPHCFNWEDEKGRYNYCSGQDCLGYMYDRALLSVGLQVGLRRAEIAALKVSDLHQNRGFDSLRVIRKGGRKEALAINPQAAQRIRAYLDLSGHAADQDGPLFRPLKHNGKRQEARRPMSPDNIDRIVRRYAERIGMERGHSAHSMRATFITTALENGASLEDVQKAAGHRDPSTTKLYDRRGYNPEKSASFFATY